MTKILWKILQIDGKDASRSKDVLPEAPTVILFICYKD